MRARVAVDIKKILSGDENIKKIFSIAVSAVIFLLCAYYVIGYFHWRAVWDLMLRADWKWMPLTVSVTIVFFWLFRALRWSALLKAAGIDIPFFHLYLVSAVAVSLAILTPLQSGEALKVEFLKKTGALERLSGYGIFMTERVMDLLVVMLIAVLSVLFGVFRFLNNGYVFMILAVMMAGFVVLFMMVRRLSPENLIGKFFQPLRQCVKSWKMFLTIFLLTTVGWFFIVLGWYASLRSISVLIDLWQTTAMMTVTTLIGLLSLIPWSLGISEVSIASFLAYFKQEAVLSQAGALMIRLYGMVTILLGVVHFGIWKLWGKEEGVSNVRSNMS